MNNWSNPSSFDASRRRSQRVILNIPVTVSGDGPDGAFSEDTVTLVVNAHGALVALAAKISQGQPLMLKNRTNSEQQACRICYVGATIEEKTQFGFEFAKPAPEFWHIAFPPENWTPSEVSAPPVKK